MLKTDSLEFTLSREETQKQIKISTPTRLMKNYYEHEKKNSTDQIYIQQIIFKKVFILDS